MTSYELAIDQDGEPFEVPDHVAGWRVRLAPDGRGRPGLCYKHGKPLIVPVDASHADLAAAAGTGRCRLDAVDASGHAVADVPVAWTGPLEGFDAEPAVIVPAAPSGSSGRHAGGYEYVICQLVTANTRMVEQAMNQVAQFGPVMSGVAALLHAANGAGLTTRAPLPSALLAPAVMNDDDDRDDDQDDAEEESDAHDEPEAAPASGISEVVQLIIRETVNALVPVVLDKIKGGTIAGLPLEAIFDWRKAVPTPAAAAAAPTTPTAPPAPTAAPPTASAAGGTRVPPSSATSPSGTSHVPPATREATAPVMASAVVGAAPSRESPLGAAPTEMATRSATESPNLHTDTAAVLNAHILAVWQGLSLPERARASHMVARMSAEERFAWLGKLAELPVAEAIAHARAVLTMTPHTAIPTPPTTPLAGDA